VRYKRLEGGWYWVGIAPKVKGRPRFGGGHAYTDPQTKAFERELGWLLKAAWDCEVRSVPQKLTIQFFFLAPKKSKFHVPGVRPDTDNFLKAFLDSANGILYHDDALVTDINCLKRYGKTTGILFRLDEVPKLESQMHAGFLAALLKETTN
jgi:Holliday junction resolvase RusA-like endonuclease